MEDLKLYIDALHHLNEVRDSVQMIFGKLGRCFLWSAAQLNTGFTLLFHHSQIYA